MYCSKADDSLMSLLSMAMYFNRAGHFNDMTEHFDERADLLRNVYHTKPVLSL